MNTNTNTIESDERFRADVRHGFDHGNYTNAYDTEDCTAMIGALSPKASEDYRNAAIIGFFASYELSEISGEDREAYDDAYASKAGKACVEAGYIDRQDEQP